MENTLPAVMVEREHARRLIDLAAGDVTMAREIATFLLELPHDRPLPDTQTLTRRLRSGIPGGVNITVGDYLTWWIAHRRIDEHTRMSYASHIRVHLIPHLGTIRLTGLTIAGVDAMFTAIRHDNDKIVSARRSRDPAEQASAKGRRLITAATMHRIRATLRKALNDAIGKYRLLDHNPAVHVELEQPMRPMAREWTDAAVAQWRAGGYRPSSVMVWTPAHAGQFLDYVEVHDPVLYPLFLLAMIGGPRRGEAVGVRTDEVDLDNASVTFSHQIATHGFRPVYKKVKTQNGVRVVALDAGTVAELRGYWRRRRAWQQATGSSWPTVVEVNSSTADGSAVVGVDLFFRQPDGRAWHPDTITRRFERHVMEAGLPPVRFHDARHGAATYARAVGGDLLDLKRKLGHCSVAVAGDLYPIVLQELERELAERSAALIPRRRRPTPPQATSELAGSDGATWLSTGQTPSGRFPVQQGRRQDCPASDAGENADKRIPTQGPKTDSANRSPRALDIQFSDADDTDWRSIRGSC